MLITLLYVMKNSLSSLLLLFGILLCSACTIENPDGPGSGTNYNWETATAEELEENLKQCCKENNGDINAIVAELKKNKNIESASPSADNTSVIVKFKNSDDYAVYPIFKMADPFDEEDSYEEGAYSLDSFQANSFEGSTKADSRNKIAVFNYFSNDLSRNTQNKMLEFMMNDMKSHGFRVAYYPYEKMTISNLCNVCSNEKDYVAVIFITHGFTVGYNSYFVLGEEYDRCKNDADYKRLVGPDEAQQKVPWSVRFWNQGFGAFNFDARYDCAIDVSKIKFWAHTILYMGSCDAFRNDEPMGTSIGWDSNNVTAQAHVTLLMYNLMRGKSLANALDQQESPYYNPNPYYAYTGDQVDTWTKDPITNAKMKCAFRGGYAITPYGAESITSFPNYYKDGLISVKSYISKGPLFLSDKSRKVSFSLGNAAGLGGDAIDYPDKLYLTLTPLRSDESPQLYMLKEKKGSPGEYGVVEFKFSDNGLFVVSAFADEGLTKEILFRKPMVFVRAKPFKENGDDEEMETAEPTEGDLIDLGLSVKWASCNLGASEPQEPGDYYAWGETQTKSTYNWSTYKWCNGTETSLKKYCTQSTCGTVDNKISLDLSDDAAYANSQGKMRMPTSEEWRELRDNCTWTKTHYKERAGYLVSSPSTGNAIFIPCNGLKVTDILNDDASYYWGADLNAEVSSSAEAFLWPSIMKWTRCDGLGVRPVANTQANDNPEVETIAVNGISFKMVRVEGGTFTMESDFLASPQTVTLKDFSIGQTEVTQELWEAVMGYNPSGHKGKKLPVESVSWNDCQKFLKELNSLSGKTFSLPMMAEYEYAARGGQKTHNYQFAGSNEVDDVAWYLDNSDNQTHPVALKMCNELGLYDLSGNVWEISCDYSDDGLHRTFGGCASNPREEVTITSCVSITADEAYSGIGFRLAISDGPNVDVPTTPTPEDIDLGLSVKWASFNLGASKPEEYGDYFAWGETEPYYSSLNPLKWKPGKEKGYDWKSYKWCKGEYNTLTKYCYNSSYGYNGFFDNKTVLDLEDDAAHFLLGNKWRMPTMSEVNELTEKCKWQWIYLNGVKCCKFTATNGNSIILPAAEGWYKTEFSEPEVEDAHDGAYHISTLSSGEPYTARCFSIRSDVVGCGYTNRTQGLPIRPVCPKD